MNIEQAIKIIECFFRESDNKCANGECDFASPMRQYDREAAFEIALSALREKAEREGCVWCKEDNKVFHDGQHFHFFCSYCGKRLEVNNG